MKINELFESASVGATSAGAIATAPGKVGKGKVQKRPKGSLFAEEQGVAEAGRHGYDDSGMSLAPGHDEGEPVYNPRFDRTGQYDRKAKYSQDYNYNTGKPLGAPEPAKKGFVFYNVADPQTAQKLGLKQTKSGKWYLPTGNVFAQKQADKVFGKGKIWYPKESVEENKKGVRAVKHTTKPRNPVAKNASAAIGGGAAGAHKDKKKAAKQGDVKHKKPAYEDALNQALAQSLRVMEGYGRYWCSTDKKWKERKGPKQSRK